MAHHSKKIALTIALAVGFSFGVMAETETTRRSNLQPLEYHSSLPQGLSSVEFRSRFAGRFLPLVKREPFINKEEGELFDKLYPLLDNDKFDEALSELNKALANERAGAALHLLKGQVLLQQDKPKAAILSFALALDIMPDFQRAHSYKGLAHMLVKQYRRALSHYVRAVELDANDGSLYGSMGYVYTELKQFHAAEYAYQQALLLDPENWDWKINYAYSLIENEKNQQAASYLDELIRQDPNQLQLWRLKVNAHLSQQDYRGALHNMELMRRISPLDAESLHLLGNLYMHHSLYEQATLRYINAFNEGFPANKDTVSQNLTNLIHFEQWPLAERYLDAARNRAKNGGLLKEDADIMLLEAKLLLGKNQSNKAISLLENVLAQSPLHHGGLMLIAEQYAKRKQYIKASLYFERLIEAHGTSRNGFISYANMEIERKRYSKAYELLTVANNLQRDPQLEKNLEILKQLQ